MVGFFAIEEAYHTKREIWHIISENQPDLGMYLEDPSWNCSSLLMGHQVTNSLSESWDHPQNLKLGCHYRYVRKMSTIYLSMMSIHLHLFPFQCQVSDHELRPSSYPCYTWIAPQGCNSNITCWVLVGHVHSLSYQQRVTFPCAHLRIPNTSFVL